jgi:hypothetical protein
VEQRHYKLGAFHRVADHLYRYSATKKYYAVFKCHGKTRWVSLNTTDRELAGRRVKDEIAKHRRLDAKAVAMKLEALLGLYEQSIQGFAKKTQGTRKSILKMFRNGWKHGLDMDVKVVTKGQLVIWLNEQRGRLKNSSFNEYTRFIRQLFEVALNHGAIVEFPGSRTEGGAGRKADPSYPNLGAVFGNCGQRPQPGAEHFCG